MFLVTKFLRSHFAIGDRKARGSTKGKTKTSLEAPILILFLLACPFQLSFFFFLHTLLRFMAEVRKDGYLSVKEDGIRAWIWSKRYAILREQTLTFHRNEVNGLSASVY
jgi:hypothetical protein